MPKKNKLSLKIGARTKDYIVQAILIFTSVFLAFYLNNISDDNRRLRQKSAALNSIKQELYRNAAIVEVWHKRHEKIYNNINNILNGSGDSLKIELLKHEFLNLGILTNNESLVNEILIITAWETSKTTGIISEFDFQTTKDLTYVYSTQQVLTDKTLMKILDFYFDMEAHKMENLDAILIQFQLRFGELIGQEYLLKKLYMDAIKSVE